MTFLEKALRWTARIGVFMVPFIPLIVSGSMFFPFITGKNFAFRIVAEIIVAAWILLALRVPRFRPKSSALLWALIAFLFIILVADIFGANPFKSFWSNFERMEGFVTLLHLFGYFLVAAHVLDTEKLWLRFFATSVGVSALLGLYGILQLAGKVVINQGGVRLDGTFGNAAYFAGYMLFHIFLALFLFFRHRIGFWGKWLYGGAILLQVFTLYFTATRGAFVGLVSGLFLASLLVALFERENIRLRKFSFVSLAVVALFVGALYFGRETDFIKENPVLTRFASISLESGSARFMVWGMAFEGFKENPLLGWGQENFNFVFNKYYDSDMWGQEQWFDRTHNIFFDWLIAGGLLGLLSYLALFVLLLFSIWKSKGNGSPFAIPEKSILTGLLAAYFAHNFFVFDNIGSYLLFFSFLGFMHTRIARPVLSETRPALSLPGAYYATVTVMILLLGVSIYFVNIRSILAATDLVDALKGQKAEENIKIYERAMKRGSFAEQEIAEQVTQAAANVIADKNAPPEIKEKFASTALGAFSALILHVPDDARHRVFIGSFLNRIGQFAEAQVQLEKAHELSPTKQTIAFELASSYLSTGKTTEALSLLKGAFDSAPAFLSARLVYVTAAIYGKQFALADTLLAEEPDAALTDERILKAYFDTKQFGKVLEIWQKRVVREPENAQARISLAAAYLLSGRRPEAIRALQEAIPLNPEAKTEIEFYISEIRAGRNP